MIGEFKNFLMRGNVVSLAVAFIIGEAFHKIVDAVVHKLIMPIIGIFTGGINFEHEVYHIGGVEIGWGVVFQEIINFIIIGFVLFFIIKAYNHATKPDIKVEEVKTEQWLEKIHHLISTQINKEGDAHQ